jgi:hypothetical protein
MAYYFDQFDEHAYRDRPLTFRYHAPDFAEFLGLPPAPDAAFRLVRDVVLAEVCLAAEEGRWLSYSRHEGFYRRSRYRSPDFTYTRMMSVVAQLDRTGCVTEDRATPGERGWQSRLKATPALYQAWIDLAVTPVFDHRGEILFMKERGKDGRLVEYPQTPETIKLRNSILPINEMLDGLTLNVPGGRLVRPNLMVFERDDLDEDQAPIVKQQFVRTVSGNAGRRIFAVNRDSRGRLRFNRHGRFYCWPQNIPSAARRNMLMHGESVVELDFVAHHPRLAYSLAGARLDRDPYDLGGGFERKHVKAGTVIAFNAANPRSAVAALADDQNISRSHSAKIIEAIYEHNEPIKSFLCNDAGVALMHADSQIMMGVVTDLIAAGAPSIPVHDSVIVQVRFRGLAEQKLCENWHKATKHLNPCCIE